MLPCGYVPAEKNKQISNFGIDVIAVDSIYTPVLKVNYSVVAKALDFPGMPSTSR